MILVTGATGSVGGTVVRELLAQGVAPTAMIRDLRDASKLPAGVEPVQGDFSDPASLRRALRGADAAYLVCGPVPELVELETNFLTACREEGTPNVVLQSALGAGDFPKSFPAWHRRVEDKARAMQIPASILRPNGFMQNIATSFAPSIRAQDRFYDGLGSARISYIDVRDIAVAAARLLRSADGIGKTYELHGPEPIGDAELAARFSEAAGRPIACVSLTLDQMKQGMIASGMPEARATPVVELYEYYLSGRGEGSDQVLRDLIRKPPRTLDAYLREIAPLLGRQN